MKKFMKFALMTSISLSMVACGSSEETSSPAVTETPQKVEEAEPVVDKSLLSPDNDMVVALNADITNLDPHIASNGVSNTIADTMYESLVEFNEDLEIVPSLAKEWSISEDGLSYTFTLNDGIKFHDGEPFNAEAVLANYQRGIDNPSLRIAYQISSWESVSVESEYQFTIKLKAANNTFLNKLTQIRIASPKAILAGESEFAKASAGTGPYILSDRVEGGYTTVVTNQDYWGTKPGIDSLTFKVVPEEGSMVAMLQTGEADIISPLPAIQANLLLQDSSIELVNFPGITYRYATLNQNYTLEDGRKPFADVRVRQAMNYAFDSNAYAMVVFNGFAVEPNSIYSESIQYHSPQTPYSKDNEKALALMSEAGYADGFPVDIWVDNTTREMQGAEFFKQQMSEIGIDVNVVPMESTTIAEMTSLPAEENKVNIWYVNWSSGSYEADGSMRSILHSDKFPPAGYNTAFYQNDEFNTLIDDALILTDTTEIADLYAQAQAIAWNDAPWVFLGNDDVLIGEKVYVEGVRYTSGADILFGNASLKQE